MSLSPYSKLRLSRLGLYNEPEHFSRATKGEILRKLMAKEVSYDIYGNMVEPVSPGFEDDLTKFVPPNISFSPDTRGLLRTEQRLDDLYGRDGRDWMSRSYSAIPFTFNLDTPQTPVRSPQLEEFSFRSPSMLHSTPVKVAPYMANKSIQLSPTFVAKSDYCKDNHWKVLAYEYITVELFSMLTSHGVDLDPRIKYSPHVLMEMMWDLLSKMEQEKLRIENEAINNSSGYIRDIGAKIETHNRSVLSQLYDSEKELLRQRRINSQSRQTIIDLKARLQDALVNVAFPPPRDEEHKALAKLAASQDVITLLNEELRIKRERNAYLEEKVLSLLNQIAEIQAGCAQDLTEAAQISILGEEAIESAITSYIERATQCSPQVLSHSEWRDIGVEAVKQLKFCFEYNERHIKDLESEIVAQNKTLNTMEAERLKLKDKIYELDFTLRQQQHMIKLYEEELEPAGREIREWIEYAARKERRPAPPGWSPKVPDPYEAFAPEGYSSPLPGDLAFREISPLRRRIYKLRSPEAVYVRPLLSPMPPIDRAVLRASPPPADAYSLPGSPVVVASPQYAIASPETVVQTASPQLQAVVPVVPGSPVGFLLNPLDPYSQISSLGSVTLPSGISDLSDSLGVFEPVNFSMSEFPSSFVGRPADVPSLFSDMSATSPDFRASTPVRELQGGPSFFGAGEGRQLNHSVLLNSPYRVSPVQLDMSVNSRPLQQTRSGEHLVCDISLSMEDHEA